MGSAFESHDEHEFDTDVDTIWNAVATGDGMNGWYLGSTTIEPGVGGEVLTRMGPVSMESSVTAWDPPRHFAYREVEDGQGRFQAFEFLIEGRDHGSTVLRLIASGFLPGDDWEDELEAMTRGGELFFATLITYLTHYAGRPGVPIMASGPAVPDWDQAFTKLAGHLGLTSLHRIGAPAEFDDPVRGPVSATLEFASPHAIALRETDAIYRFVRGFHSGGIMAMHNDFTPGAQATGEAAPRAWSDWLHRLYR